MPDILEMRCCVAVNYRLAERKEQASRGFVEAQILHKHNCSAPLWPNACCVNGGVPVERNRALVCDADVRTTCETAAVR